MPHAQTTWDAAAGWYNRLVGERGMEMQQQVVFPNTKRLLGNTAQGGSLVDIACGQGAFIRYIGTTIARALGIDQAPQLIAHAKKMTRQAQTNFLVADITRALPSEAVKRGQFDAATCILALQNIDPLAPALSNCARLLKPGGVCVLVMTHPCFRGPRISSWGWDEAKKMQYRRVDRYMTSMKVPIATHPGARPGQITWTYHRPLHEYAQALRQAGFMIEQIEEWNTHKTSTPGPRAKADQRSKQEIPLFMAIRAVKRI